MADLTDPYVIAIVTTRTDERASAILDMLDIMIDEQYIGPLEESLNIDMSDISACAIATEQLIVKTFVRFVGRMSINLDEEELYKHPATGVALYLMLTEGLDSFEDADGLLNIALSEEEPVYILQRLLYHVKGDPSYHVDTVVAGIQPSVLSAIQNVLTARVIDEEPESESSARRARISAYLREFPDNPDGWLYLESPITIQPSVLASQLKHMEDERRFLIIHTVGMAIFYNDDPKVAYEQSEGYLELLNTTGVPKFEILAITAPVIQSVFDMSAAAVAAAAVVEGIENEA